jgi:hypothetical protein
MPTVANNAHALYDWPRSAQRLACACICTFVVLTLTQTLSLAVAVVAVSAACTIFFFAGFAAGILRTRGWAPSQQIAVIGTYGFLIITIATLLNQVLDRL